MTRLLGIDLGTSSVKVVIIDEQANIRGVGAEEYPILIPRPNWAEQDPEDWWKATISAVRQALKQSGDKAVDAIGFSGQSHGGVLLDADNRPIGNAIIWADQRSAQEVDEVIDLIGRDQLARIAGTAPATGFIGPTLLWLQKHDPATIEKARHFLLPKDYVRFRLTGEVAVEATDAATTSLFDIRQRQWSTTIIETLNLPESIWPAVFEAADIVGSLTKAAADELGVEAGVPVSAGSGDQPAQAVGNGLIDPGIGSITIGTGGQLFAPQQQPQVDPELRLHTFCHAPADRWFIMGAMLSAGLSLRWLRDLHGMTGDPQAYEKFSALAAQVPPGAGGLLFLPYLVGERSPLMDPLARGCFVGLTLGHGIGHLARAIMEGVSFAMRQNLDVMLGLGTPIEVIVASGGGMAAPLWRQIMADIFERPLRLSAGRERAGVGAAVIGGVGIGTYSSYQDAQRAVAAPYELTEPNPEQVRLYREQYARFAQVYPLLKPVMHALH
ncbi:MAG: xylulokinase [Anaerolineae bacterium]|nr:xylulokinase [Anaerolineae bacterium]